MALALLRWLHGLLLETPAPELEAILEPSRPAAVVVVVHGRTFAIRVEELMPVASEPPPLPPANPSLIGLR